MLTGPDVSEHQGDVNWRKVASKHELAIVRVADGDHRDAFYGKGRVDAIRAAGLLLAPYQFARVASPQNGQRDGSQEAAMAIRFAKAGGWSWSPDLPLIYDFETDNGQPLDKCARHIVQFVRAYKRSQKHYPGIYTMPGFWRRVLPHLGAAERRLIARCFLHQADWGVGSPHALAPWDGATIWQFSDDSPCPGVSGKVDMNRTIAPEATVRALARQGKSPGRPPAKGKTKPADGHPADVPPWVPKAHWQKWTEPWKDAAARSRAFRDLCWQHGYLSPHFLRKEAACHDPASTPVPNRLRANAQRQAFALERLRHGLGDRPLPTLSWLRTTEWNARVGGVSQSRHLQGDATDFTVQTIQSFGTARFDAACERVFSRGGFGRYPSGSRHVDSRGSRARW